MNHNVDLKKIWESEAFPKVTIRCGGQLVISQIEPDPGSNLDEGDLLVQFVGTEIWFSYGRHGMSHDCNGSYENGPPLDIVAVSDNRPGFGDIAGGFSF